MCQPKRLGGRRCPSHSDPVLVAARNARRREKYHVEKDSSLAQTSVNLNETGVSVTNAVERSVFRNSFFDRDHNGKKVRELVNAKDSTVESTKINIRSSENEGYLVENKYFSEKEITGKINYNNIDENSYLEFGFQKVDENYVQNRLATKLPLTEIQDLSRIELEQTTHREKKAIRLFTSNNYSWINNHLYSHGEQLKPASEPRKDENYLDRYKLSGKIDQEKDINHSLEDLEDIVESLDTAIGKAPKTQRIVYRGVSVYSDVFVDTTPEKWLKENVALGKEFKHDGFASSSLSFDAMRQYAKGDDSIIYEILTSEGINVSSISQFAEEEEVVLPRQSRYMVVGIHKGVNYGSATLVQMVAINEEGDVLTGDNTSKKTKPFS